MSCPLQLVSSLLLHLIQADHPRMATSNPLVEQILETPPSAFLCSGLQPGATQMCRQGAAQLHLQADANEPGLNTTPSLARPRPACLVPKGHFLVAPTRHHSRNVSQLLASVERSVLMKDAIAEPASGQTNIISGICRRQILARIGGKGAHPLVIILGEKHGYLEAFQARITALPMTV